MLKIKIITAYPEMFPGSLSYSIIGNALANGIWSLDIIDLHKFGLNERKNIDDEPFGGGPGMVIRPDVVEKALLSINYEKGMRRRLIYLTPSGKPLKQSNLTEFCEFNELIILCGRFEGVDQRAINVLNFTEISIGDYVLAGGEIAAQVLVEGCIRLLPGVLGQPESLLEESFTNDLLEYPQYTRPQVWKDADNNNNEVPKILLSGHHKKIKMWRENKSIEKTQINRPDLFKKKKKNRNEK
jgi:tRNA (guanine37-N1)-methyltransferase